MTNENQPTDKLHDKQHTHIQDKIKDKDNDNFDETAEGIDISFLPSNIFYKMLGVHFIPNKISFTTRSNYDTFI